MRPRLFTFDTPEWLHGFLPETLSVYAYGLMIALGVLAAFIVVLRLSRPMNLNADDLSSLFMWVFAASFVGGRLFFYLEDIQRYLKNPSEMLRISGGGFVFYGSLLFAVPVIAWWLKRRNIAFRPFADILAVAGPVVHSFGRVGCFMAGCCHGSECLNPAIGVMFTDPESMAPKNVLLYPTQLFDIGVNLIILMVIVFLWKRKQFAGQLFLIYLTMYAVGRSIVEMYRGDEARGFLFNGLLSHSQFIAIVVIAVSAWLWLRWKKTPAEKI